MAQRACGQEKAVFVEVKREGLQPVALAALLAGRVAWLCATFSQRPHLTCGPPSVACSGDEVLEPHPWWVDHLSHKVRTRMALLGLALLDLALLGLALLGLLPAAGATWHPAVPPACCPVMFALWADVSMLRFQRCTLTVQPDLPLTSSPTAPTFPALSPGTTSRLMARQRSTSCSGCMAMSRTPAQVRAWVAVVLPWVAVFCPAWEALPDRLPAALHPRTLLLLPLRLQTLTPACKNCLPTLQRSFWSGSAWPPAPRAATPQSCPASLSWRKCGASWRLPPLASATCSRCGMACGRRRQQCGRLKRRGQQRCTARCGLGPQPGGTQGRTHGSSAVV